MRLLRETTDDEGRAHPGADRDAFKFAFRVRVFARPAAGARAWVGQGWWAPSDVGACRVNIFCEWSTESITVIMIESNYDR